MWIRPLGHVGGRRWAPPSEKHPSSLESPSKSHLKSKWNKDSHVSSISLITRKGEFIKIINNGGFCDSIRLWLNAVFSPCSKCSFCVLTVSTECLCVSSVLDPSRARSKKMCLYCARPKKCSDPSKICLYCAQPCSSQANHVSKFQACTKKNYIDTELFCHLRLFYSFASKKKSD